MFLTKSMRRVDYTLSYRESSKGDLDVGADEVLLVAAKHVLEVGHDRGVHPRQAIRSVYSH